MAEFKPGDRVWVTDDGLRELRRIMRSGGYTPMANHHGTVHEVDGNEIEIWFDNEDGEGMGQCSFYERRDVRHFPDPEYPAVTPKGTDQ